MTAPADQSKISFQYPKILKQPHLSLYSNKVRVNTPTCVNKHSPVESLSGNLTFTLPTLVRMC